MNEEAEENCHLSVGIIRPYNTYKPEELAALPESERSARESRSPFFMRFGHAYVRLVDEDRQIRGFHFIASALHRLDYLTRPAGAIAVPCVGSIEEIQQELYLTDAAINHPITHEQYDRALTAATQHKKGVYHLLLNNCVDYVAKVACAAGIELPRHTIMTPSKMARDAELIGRYNQEQIRIWQGETNIDRMFSDKTPAPHISPTSVGYGFSLTALADMWKKGDQESDPEPTV